MSRQVSFSVLYCSSTTPAQFLGYRYISAHWQFRLIDNSSQGKALSSFLSLAMQWSLKCRFAAQLKVFQRVKSSSPDITVYLQRWLLTQNVLIHTKEIPGATLNWAMGPTRHGSTGSKFLCLLLSVFSHHPGSSALQMAIYLSSSSALHLWLSGMSCSPTPCAYCT